MRLCISTYIMYTAQLLRYYFGSTGKAYAKSYGKTINGKKYGFDDDGKMLFGYVEDASYNIVNDDEDPILRATYYYGTNEDGARHSGWLQYTDALSDSDKYDEDYYWFYFNTSNGKKETNKVKSINGKKYSFNDDGVMEFKWQTASAGDKLTTTWFGKLEDGALAKNQWIWNKPYGAENGATLDSTIEDKDSDTQRWFRTDASGALVKGKTKKVNSKWYVFDQDGVMRTGLVVLKNVDKDGNDTGAVSGAEYAKSYDMDAVTEDELFDADNGVNLHYFSEDEEKDGSMKTGTMKIELSDDTYTFCFSKNTGAAKHGYDSSSKKIYRDGMLQDAGDDRYKVVEDVTTGNKYLVGSTGTILKAVNKYKDANDKYYIYVKTGDTTWSIYETYVEDNAKDAVKAAKSDDKSKVADYASLVGSGDSKAAKK